MSDNCPRDKTRAALKNLEPWADNEINRLEKNFAAQRRSDEMAAKSSSVSDSLLARALATSKNVSFTAGFLLGLISGLALSALIILL